MNVHSRSFSSSLLLLLQGTGSSAELTNCVVTRGCSLWSPWPWTGRFSICSCGSPWGFSSPELILMNWLRLPQHTPYVRWVWIPSHMYQNLHKILSGTCSLHLSPGERQASLSFYKGYGLPWFISNRGEVPVPATGSLLWAPLQLRNSCAPTSLFPPLCKRKLGPSLRSDTLHLLLPTQGFLTVFFIARAVFFSIFFLLRVSLHWKYLGFCFFHDFCVLVLEVDCYGLEFVANCWEYPALSNLQELTFPNLTKP